jgi:uncharacterized membrane protein
VSDRALRFAVALVALVGAGIAGYLTWAHYADAEVICVRGGGCETVQSSDYAELVGIPVALLGLGAYVAVLALVVWDAWIARVAATAIAVVGVVFSLYLLAVQAFVLEAFCIWCVVNDVFVAPTLALLTAFRLARSASEPRGQVKT